MKTKGARLTTEISLPGRFVVYVPNGEGLGVSRRLEDDERTRLKDDPQGARRQGGRRHRPHRRRGRVRRGRRARPRLPAAALEDDPGAARRARSAPTLVYQEAELPLRDRRATSSPATSRRRTIDNERTLQAHRRLPEEDVAAHGRARASATRRRRRCSRRTASTRRSRRRSNRRVDLPSGGYLDLRLRRGVHRHRRRTPAASSARARKNSSAAARGHDHEEQPRGGEGGRAPAAAARHRRDHRHRLHRHGEPEEPRVGRGGAAHRARARPHEDVRRRDLAARPRRDDAAERHRRPARDPDAQVPDVRRRRHRRLRSDAGDAGRAQLRALAARGQPRPGVHGRAAPAHRSQLVVGPGGSRLAAIEEATERRFFLVPAEGHVHADHFEVRRRGQARRPAARTRLVAEGADRRAEARRGRPLRRDGGRRARSTASTCSSRTRRSSSARRRR